MSHPAPTLSVVIVNWRSCDFLRACLASLRAHPSRQMLQRIVVDAGSFDGSAEMVAQHFPEVQFVQSTENLGFAAANNLGARFAAAPALLFLNPDCEVPHGALDALCDAAQALPLCGIVGARLLNTDRSLQLSCVMPRPTLANQLLDTELLLRCFPQHRLWRSGLSCDAAGPPVAVEAVSGACMWVAREVFERVGGFSTDYFMYAEDLDLCWKATQAGLQNYHVPTARMVHHGGGSSRQSPSAFATVMTRESLRRLLARMRGPAYARAYRAGMGLSAVARLGLLGLSTPWWLARGRTGRWQAALRKWRLVLRWSLGLEPWVKTHGQPSPLPCAVRSAP